MCIYIYIYIHTYIHIHARTHIYSRARGTAQAGRGALRVHGPGETGAWPAKQVIVVVYNDNSDKTHE